MSPYYLCPDERTRPGVHRCTAAHARTDQPGGVGVQAMWEAYFDSGRERSHKDAVQWAKELVELGAGAPPPPTHTHTRTIVSAREQPRGLRVAPEAQRPTVLVTVACVSLTTLELELRVPPRMAFMPAEGAHCAL